MRLMSPLLSHRVVPVPETHAETDWLDVPNLDMTQAERLLDWLENNGIPQRRVEMGPDGTWWVHYRQRHWGFPSSSRGPCGRTHFSAEVAHRFVRA